MPADIDSRAVALIKSCLPPCLWISSCAVPAGPLLEPWITHLPPSSALSAFQSRFPSSQSIQGQAGSSDSAQWLSEKWRKERKNLFSIVLANWTESCCAFAGLSTREEVGTQSWGKDTPWHGSLTCVDQQEQHKTSDKEWMAQGGSECQMLPKFSFIYRSLQYESGLTLFMSILVDFIHSDVMTRYNFPGGFGVFFMLK